VHDTIRIERGRRPEGQFEALVGRTAHVKIGVDAEVLAPGAMIVFEGRAWTVVGTFSDGGSLIESEIWVNQDDMMTAMRRRTHSFVVARFQSAEAAVKATELFTKTGAIEKSFKGWTEPEYYETYSEALSWIFWLSIFLVVLVTGAGILIGVNTMYTAIVSRMGEIATQRVLGFSSFDIASSLLAESLAIALLGGLAGAIGGSLINGLGLKISHGAFNLTVDAPVILAGMGVAVVIGTMGALLPAIKGLRMSIVRAMRHE
jgi:putative ABC transport system permease protein